MNKLIVVLLTLFGVSTQLHAEWKVSSSEVDKENEIIFKHMLGWVEEYYKKYGSCPYVKPGQKVEYEFFAIPTDYFETEAQCVRYIIFKETFDDQKYAVTFECVENKRTKECSFYPLCYWDISIDEKGVMSAPFIHDLIQKTINGFPNTEVSNLLKGVHDLVLKPFRNESLYKMVKMEVFDPQKLEKFGIDNIEPIRMDVMLMDSPIGGTDFIVKKESTANLGK